MTEKQITRYLRKHLKQSFKVIILPRINGGYGAFMSLTIRTMLIRKDCSNFLPLIWHEMGHCWDGDYDSFVLNEVKAQLAALRRLKKLGYQKIYDDSVKWIKTRWGKTKTESSKEYALAAKKILKAIKK